MKNSFSKLRFAPFVHLVPSLRQTSFAVAALIAPQLVALAADKSYRALAVIALSAAASALSELAAALWLKRKGFGSGAALAEGLVIGMFLPESYPPVQVFLLVFVSMLVMKQFFGGLAANWANPAAVTVVIAWFMGAVFFPQCQITRPMLESANPASALFASGAVPLEGATASVTDFLNAKLFGRMGIVLPDGYCALFWDTHAPVPAFRFNLLTLAASIVLISFNMVEPLIPACFVAVYAVLVRVFALMPFTGAALQGDVFLALLTSGTLFCAFFLLPCYGTTPLSNAGKIIYGVLAGIGAFAICGCGTSPAGSVFTVIAVNAVSPLIQVIEDYCYAFFKADALRTRIENER